MALTEVDDLVVRIEHEPDNIILAAMLVDELVEARGMHRWEAMLHVQRVQSAARDVCDIKFATDLIRAKGFAFEFLVATLRTNLAIHVHEPMTLFVVGGDGAPEVMIPPDQAGGGVISHGYPISLPAGWVRRLHAETRYPIRSRKRRDWSPTKNVRGPRRLPPAEQR